MLEAQTNGAPNQNRANTIKTESVCCMIAGYLLHKDLVER